MDLIEAKAREAAQLLPRGRLWAGALRVPGLGGLLRSIAAFLARFENRLQQLPLEADPRYTAELLPEWEASVGLPDGCTGPLSTIQARRSAVVGRLNATGGCSVEYFRGICASLGWPDVEIDEYGVKRWRITLPGVLYRELTCVDTCAEPLRVWNDDTDPVLECALNRYKPADTDLQLLYGT